MRQRRTGLNGRAPLGRHTARERPMAKKGGRWARFKAHRRLDHAVLGVRHSALGVHHSGLGVHHSAPGVLPRNAARRLVAPTTLTTTESGEKARDACLLYQRRLLVMDSATRKLTRQGPWTLPGICLLLNGCKPPLVGYRGGKRMFLIRVQIQILVPVASSLYWASAPDGS